MDFPGHFEQIFQQLNYQRVHGQLWDCVIVVGSRHFKAHRSVLAACSTHFRALFTVAEGDASMNMIQLDSEVRVLKGWVTEDTRNLFTLECHRYYSLSVFFTVVIIFVPNVLNILCIENKKSKLIFK